jgi:hypothetical protein
MKKRTPKSSNSAEQANYKIGQFVVVRPGTADPDYGFDMDGWQGRATENQHVDEQKSL